MRSPAMLLLLALLTGLTACSGTPAQLPPDVAQELARNGDGTSDANSGNGAAGSTNADGAAPTFEVLFRSASSGIAEERRELVRDDARWAELWAELTSHMEPAPQRPEIDFATTRVLVAAAGARGSGGHSVDIVDVTPDEEDGVHVAVRLVEPGPTCLTTQVVTHPVVVVSVPTTADSADFTSETVVFDCG